MAPALSLGLAVTLVLIGSALGLAARGDRQVPGDVATLEAIQDIDLPGLDALVTFSNLAFSTVGAIVLGILFLVATRVLRQPALALQLTIVVILRLAGEVWKPIFDSPRPGREFQPDPSLVSHTMGYPSGHAQTAAIVMSMLVVFTIALGLPRAVRNAAIGLAVTVSLFALFARIHIGAHWPSDTVGGLAYGLSAVAMMQLIVWQVTRIRTARDGQASSPAIPA